MLEKAIERLNQIYKENNLILKTDDKSTIVKIYMFYEYYNADETRIDNLLDNIYEYEYLDGIGEEEESEIGNIDIIKVLDILIEDFILDNIRNYIQNIDHFYASLFSGHKSFEKNEIRSILMDKNISDESRMQIILLCDLIIKPEIKSEIKELVTNFKSKLENLNYLIFFRDDIEEIVSDIDSPNMNVKSGVVTMSSAGQLFFHGNEKSIVTSILATSLKDLFINYGTTGLFSNNLRYYVKSSKIDKNIKDSILNEPEKFWYFNNGIIITCDDYKIKQNKIELINFSIVNGGQTTNLIGNSLFSEDFSVVCKIIKTKYENKDENLEFLSKVAETSNTQKPINMKDIIANRIEQKKLQYQLKKVGVYVQVKRGEKINRSIYHEKWQNAKNDEIGQMLFSFIYQHPGIARNSKSRMLSNDSYYDIIYKNEYNTLLLLVLQHFKVGFYKWKLRVQRIETNADKNGLARNGFFLFLAIFGFIVKIYFNKDFYKLISGLSIKHDFVEDSDFKLKISQNDIGKLAIFKNSNIISEREIAYEFFDFLYDNYVIEAYRFFKNLYPNYAYSNFTKNDTYYYRTVIPKLTNLINKYWTTSVSHKNYFDKYFLCENENEVGFLSDIKIFNEYKPGLSQELTEYRRNKYREYQGKVEAYHIFTNNQRSKINFYKPKTLSSLRNDCGMKSFSINNFGEDILNIVKKYVIV